MGNNLVPTYLTNIFVFTTTGSYRYDSKCYSINTLASEKCQVNHATKGDPQCNVKTRKLNFYLKNISSIHRTW